MDENGAYMPHRRLAQACAIRSWDSAVRHVTAAYEPGGCAYWRHDEQPVNIWPDALSAQVSNDGHFIAVRSADRVALYFDPD